MSPSSITITVQLFAAYQDAVGAPQVQLQLPEGSTVQTVCDRLVQAHPELAPWQAITRFGVNLNFVEATTPLKQGDEVVLIPPVSGG